MAHKAWKNDEGTETVGGNGTKDQHGCQAGRTQHKQASRTCAGPRHVRGVQVRLAIVADELAVRAVEHGRVRADLLYLLRARAAAASVVELDLRLVHLVRGQALRVACDDVAAQARCERGAEARGRTGARFLQVWRD